MTPDGSSAATAEAKTSSSWPLTTRNGGRQAAMRHRNAGGRRRRDGARHARHDVERHAGRSQRQRLFPAAAEDERIAALQPHHAAGRASRRESSPRESRPARARDGRRACRRRSAARGARASTRARRPARRTAPDRRLAAAPTPSASAGPDRRARRRRATHAHWSRPSSSNRSLPRPRSSARSSKSSVQRLEQQRPARVHRHPSRRQAVAPAAPRASSGRGRAAARRRAPRAAAPSSPGASPLVEIASVTPSRRTTPLRNAVAFAGSSTALTKIRAPRPPPATARFTSGVAAATTSQAASRSAG